MKIRRLVHAPCRILVAALPLAAALALAAPPQSPADAPIAPATPQVHRGQHGTGWTVFSGTEPEPFDVEILGVLRGARGPQHDMILAVLHGPKAEFTGVAAGMSGSPVYIDGKLLGAIAFRIGQFSKDAIAGITPIADMLDVANLPAVPLPNSIPTPSGTLQPMETPVVLSGFRPEAIALWQQKFAGTSLQSVGTGGSGANSSLPATMSPHNDVRPGSAVSAQLVRGDLEVAATCTVTYVDPQQLLACGHPILQAGTISVPMTKAEVVTTLASPMNAFKIVNTGQTIGSFTEDRDAAIRGIFGRPATMIPVSVALSGAGVKDRTLHFELLDLQSLTPQTLLVSIYQALLESNDSTADLSYHLTGHLRLADGSASPLDLWASSGDSMPAPMVAALLVGDKFVRIYSNPTRTAAVTGLDLAVQAFPRRMQVDLESAHIVGSNLVHAGDRIEIEASLRDFAKPARTIRIPLQLPARLAPGNLRLLVSDALTLDKALNQPRQSGRPADADSERQLALHQHPADRIYLTLLTAEPQAGLSGQTLRAAPLSVTNALEPARQAIDANLNGETAELETDAPAGGPLNGAQLLNLRIEPGAGLN